MVDRRLGRAFSGAALKPPSQSIKMLENPGFVTKDGSVERERMGCWKIQVD
jgi:hypothetical protein